MNYKGSCLCGTIQFEIEGEFEQFFLCHCSRCRKDSGSAHAATLFSTTASLQWVTGENEVKIYNHLNSGHVKGFCQYCGSAVPTIQMDGALLAVPAGSLDTSVEIKPNGHIFYAHRANWDFELENSAKYDELPETDNER